MNFLKRLFGLHTVDTILADFHKITDRLRAHIDVKAAEVEAHDAVLNRVRDLKFAASNEAQRAMGVVRNIEALLGVSDRKAA